jgi:hypothetical protein
VYGAPLRAKLVREIHISHVLVRVREKEEKRRARARERRENQEEGLEFSTDLR